MDRRLIAAVSGCVVLAAGAYFAWPSSTVNADPQPEVVATEAITPPVSPESKLAQMREAVAAGRGASTVGLLRDPDVTVRRGAILAVGVDTAVNAETLFASLHDSDAEIRELAVSALRSRGLSVNQVSFARQFTHRDPAERLSLLVDLANGAVSNPGPWLERLAEDPVPAVRLGAARVASELGVKAPWIKTIATNDNDPAVRTWAAFYRDQSGKVERTGHSE